jgi:mediator of RNA polymerase II transcription subunit 16
MASYEMAQTVIDRWEAVEQQQPLQSAILDLGNKKGKATSELPTITILRKLEPIVIDKTIIGFQSIQFGKVIVLTFADGTVKYRDRFTFEELYAAENPSKIMNLRQVGWSFTDHGPCTSKIVLTGLICGTDFCNSRSSSCVFSNSVFYGPNER